MKDQFGTLDQMTLPLSSSAISAMEFPSGPMFSSRRDSQQIESYGLARCLASLSPRQAKERGLLTSGTYGQRGSTSSASASLRSFLESRLRERTAELGSILFTLTWKVWVTPAGLSLPLLRASVRRKGGTGSTSWPTPRTPMGGPESGERKQELGRTKSGSGDLQAVALLASWVSPTAQNHSRGGKPARPWDTGIPLSQQAALASWSIPSSKDWKDTPGMSETGTNPDGSERTRLDQLPRQAVLATVSGPTPSGSPAGTGNGGQLNPALPRWLQGCPEVWDQCSPNYDDWRKWQDFMAAHSNGLRGTEPGD